MFEELTQEKILDMLLSKVPPGISKEVGSLVYTALSPVSFEIEKIYIKCDEILDQTFADSAEYEFLKRRALERGLTPLQATYTVAKGEFDVPIDEGTRFFINDLTYVSGEELERSANYCYEMTCEEEGSRSNRILGELTPIDYIDGLEYAELTEILIPGKDEEDVESFRKRYFDSFFEQSFGGNIADYVEKINSIDGVGGVHVTRTPNGGGSVGAVIIGADKLPASTALVEKVQKIMCPAPGMGYGLAPIGHTLTVESAEDIDITINTSLTYANGQSFEKLKDQLKASVESYFDKLRSTWQELFEKKTGTIVVRIAEVESRLLAVDGVIDVADTTLNNSISNLILTDSQIPVLKEVIG